MKKREECCGEEEMVCRCGSHLNRFIEPRLLILLRNAPAHGYELLEKMDDYPLSELSIEPGAIYKKLRGMEKDGLVKSEWDTKKNGPAKRVYRITEDGEERLYGWVITFRKNKDGIEKFLKAYERG